MTFNPDQPNVDQIADDVIRRTKTAKQTLLNVQSNVVGDNFSLLLDIPKQNSNFQSFLTQVISYGLNAQIKAAIDLKLNDNITFADINNFFVAVNDLANDIEANASLFLLSYDPVLKNKIYVTPVAAGVKSAIQTRISDALAFVTP